MMELLVLPSLYTALILTGDTPDTRRASSYASIAYYKQSGMDKEVSQIEDKFIPEPLQRVGVTAAVVYRLAVDHTLELSWGF